jgi:hypothetical protein
MTLAAAVAVAFLLQPPAAQAGEFWLTEIVSAPNHDWINHEFELGGEEFKIKAGFPVGFVRLSFGEAFDWGLDYVIDRDSARARKLMNFYALSADNVADVVGAVNAHSGEIGLVAIIKPAAPWESETAGDLAKIAYIGVPVKWNRRLTTALRFALAGDGDTLAGVRAVADKVVFGGAKAALTLGGANLKNPLVRNLINPFGHETFFFATERAVDDARIERAGRVLTNWTAWPTID